MEELTKTMQPLFYRGDWQSGNNFRRPEGFHWAGIRPDTHTHTHTHTHFIHAHIPGSHLAFFGAHICQ